MKQLVDDGSTGFLGVPLRRTGEGATAHMDHTAFHDGKGQHALGAALCVRFAILDDEGAHLLGDTHIQLGEPHG